MIGWLRDLWRRGPLGDKGGPPQRRGRHDTSATRRSRRYERPQAQGTGSLLGDIQQGRLDQSQGVDPKTLLVLSAFVLVGGLVLAGVAVLILQARSDSPGTVEIPIDPTPYPPNVIICEINPIELEEGTNTIVNFRAEELTGYELTRLELMPTSQNAPTGALDATIEGMVSVLLQANASDELKDEAATYELRAVFNLNDAEIVSLCNVRVSPIVAVVEAPEGPTAEPGAIVTPRPTPAPRVLEAQLTTPPTPTPTPTPKPTSTPRPRPTLTPAPTEPGDFYRR